MATIVNDIDVLLQAAGTRFVAGTTTVEWANVLDGSSTKPTDNADVTSANTAAAITSQGDLATLNVVTATEISVATLSAIESDLGTLTAGTITTSGYVRAHGTTSAALGIASIYGNENNTAAFGVAGESGTSSQDAGVIGGAMSSGTIGVKGESNNRGGGAAAVYGLASGSDYAVYANNTSATASLYVNGKMVISNSTLVTNLNADTVDGLHANSFPTTDTGTAKHLGGHSSVSATATFPLNNKPGSNTTGNTWMSVVNGGVQYWIPIWNDV